MAQRLNGSTSQWQEYKLINFHTFFLPLRRCAVVPLRPYAIVPLL